MTHQITVLKRTKTNKVNNCTILIIRFVLTLLIAFRSKHNINTNINLPDPSKQVFFLTVRTPTLWASYIAFKKAILLGARTSLEEE